VILRFYLAGHEEILRAYGGLESRFSDLSWLWELAELKTYIDALQQEHFATEGSGKWPALTEGTVADKLRRGYGGQPMMVREGTLLASMANPWASAGGVWDVQPDALTFGSNLPYAGPQNETRSLWAPAFTEGTAEGVVDMATLELGVYAEALGFGVSVSK
jgi:hypothetical protein